MTNHLILALSNIIPVIVILNLEVVRLSSIIRVLLSKFEYPLSSADLDRVIHILKDSLWIGILEDLLDNLTNLGWTGTVIKAIIIVSCTLVASARSLASTVADFSTALRILPTRQL
jgi:hypothetical protein